MMYLRAAWPNDHHHIVDWRNRSAKYFISSDEITIESHDRWLDEQNQWYFVCEDTLAPVGIVSLYNLDYEHMHAEYGRLLVCPERRGNGYGRFMLEGILTWGFSLGMNSIYGHILSNNKSALKLAASVGLKQEGVYRQHVFKYGLYVDLVRVSMLKAEYEKMEWVKPCSSYL